MSKNLDSLRWHLRSRNIQWVDEYRFAAKIVGEGKGIRQRLKDRGLKDWRFDLAIPSKKIAVEYEGLNSKKSRHTTISGYTEDCNKYNAAKILGWTVLRYTALNIENAIRDIDSIT